MNLDQLRGFVRQLGGRGKVAYGRAADDPNAVANGAADQLYGRLQQSFGDAKQQLQRGLRRLRMP